MSVAACGSSWLARASGPAGTAAVDRSRRLPTGMDWADRVDCVDCVDCVACQDCADGDEDAVTHRAGPPDGRPRGADESGVISGFWDDADVVDEAVALASMLRGLALLVDEVLSVDRDPVRAALSEDGRRATSRRTWTRRR